MSLPRRGRTMTSGRTDLSTIRLAAGPAAWRGPEVRTRDAYTYELTPSDIQELDEALRRADLRDLDPATIVREQFPLGRLGDSLKAIGREIEGGIGFGLIRGSSVERYSVREAGILLCGIGAHLGRLMPQNSKGEVINHVRDAGPDPPRGGYARGYQSGLGLPFHSDSCDTVGLLC